MRYQRMARIAKQAIDKRGGVQGLKQDMQQAADAAKGKDSLKEKAKAAAEALKQPGSATQGGAPAAPAPAAPPHDDPLARTPGPTAEEDSGKPGAG
jgi:hypothetical protein